MSFDIKFGRRFTHKSFVMVTFKISSELLWFRDNETLLTPNTLEVKLVYPEISKDKNHIAFVALQDGYVAEMPRQRFV